MHNKMEELSERNQEGNRNSLYKTPLHFQVQRGPSHRLHYFFV